MTIFFELVTQCLKNKIETFLNPPARSFKESLKNIKTLASECAAYASKSFFRPNSADQNFEEQKKEHLRELVKEIDELSKRNDLNDENALKALEDMLSPYMSNFQSINLSQQIEDIPYSSLSKLQDVPKNIFDFVKEMGGIDRPHDQDPVNIYLFYSVKYIVQNYIKKFFEAEKKESFTAAKEALVRDKVKECLGIEVTEEQHSDKFYQLKCKAILRIISETKAANQQLATDHSSLFASSYLGTLDDLMNSAETDIRSPLDKIQQSAHALEEVSPSATM